MPPPSRFRTMCARRIELGVPDQDRADRPAEPLREAQHHGVGACGRSRRAACPWRRARSTAARRPGAPEAALRRRRPASPRARRAPVTMPPAPLCVFSTHTSVASGACGERGRSARSMSSADATARPSPASTGRTCTPASAAAPAISQLTMCASGVEQHLGARRGVHPDGRSDWPSCRWGRTAPASLPSSAATCASRRRTVGSPSRTSSPTSASAIARRMAAVGRVTVSERRSMTGVELGMA